MRRQGWAQRTRDIQAFHVMSVLARAKTLEAQGHDVIHMEIGEPDFSTPAPIVRAGQAALASGQTGYTPALGLPALREAIAGLYAQRYGVDLDPARVVVTPGGSAALLLITSLLVDPGQSMLMADPSYPCNRNFLRLLGAHAKMIPTGPDSAYQLTPELVVQHWDASCSAVLAASPSNPTGTVLSREQLQNLATSVESLNGHLVVDEIYHGLTYDCRATSVLEVAPDAFVLNSFSKYFGMTGWRLGWLIAPEAAIPELEKLAQNLYICAPHMAQVAALAAFGEETMAICEERRQAFHSRRDFLLPALRDLGFAIPVTPEGAFYLYADIQKHSADSTSFCQQLLESEYLAVTPGLDFGHYRQHEHVRFAYTASLDRLAMAVDRLDRRLR
ncbi:pyridoxal phosphate-dependent aminotransferase [Halopseudomonas sp.]|jgi:aspartate/methionine/tyrosine aminotransferase|uniref:pyridoxal phosphate-dependent aminotransferase n=1 Tax=Halopseudomonas sp. TaxID=2901191 RepID=UPI0039E6004B